MAWEKLAIHLSRFKNIKTPKKTKMEAVLLSIKEVTGVLVSEEDIQIHRNVVFIETGPSHKNDIFIHKKKILATIHKKHKIVGVQDIK